MVKPCRIEKKDELDNCGKVKAILMLGIVLYHSMAFYRSGGWGPFQPSQKSLILGYMAEWLNSFDVYAFTLISGYIFYALKMERGKYSRYLSFIAKKAKRLLVPYIFIVLIWVLPTYVYFYGTNGVLSKYFLGIDPSQLWFLLMLFWIFALFWFLSDLMDRHPVIGALFVFALYVLAALCTFIPDLYSFRTGLQFMIFFYFGFILRKYGSKILMGIPSFVYIAIDLILFIMLQCFSSYTGTIFSIIRSGLTLLLHSFGAVMAFVVLQKAVNRLGNENRVINFFSNHSMAIYLVHQQLIYFTIQWFNGRVAPGIQVLINFVFALSVSTLFACLMSRTRVTRFLIGSG